MFSYWNSGLMRTNLFVPAMSWKSNLFITIIARNCVPSARLAQFISARSAYINYLALFILHEVWHNLVISIFKLILMLRNLEVHIPNYQFIMFPWHRVQIAGILPPTHFLQKFRESNGFTKWLSYVTVWKSALKCDHDFLRKVGSFFRQTKTESLYTLVTK